MTFGSARFAPRKAPARIRGIRRGIDRAGAPLEGEVHFIEHFNVGDGPARETKHVVDILLDVRRIEAGHGSTSPRGWLVKAQADFETVGAGGIEHVREVVGGSAAPLVLLLEDELAATGLHGGPTDEGAHEGEAAGPRQGRIVEAIQDRAVGEARARRGLLGRGG